MLALRLLWQKVVRPLVWIIASVHFIDFIVSVFKTIGELKEGIKTIWPIGLTIVWTLGTTLRIVGIGALEGFLCALIAIPLAEWPVILLLVPMRVGHLERLPLYRAAFRARAYLDDGNAQLTISLIGSVGGIAFAMVSDQGILWHIANPPAHFEMEQLAVYLPGCLVLLLLFGLAVSGYLWIERRAEPFKKDLEARLSGERSASGPVRPGLD